MAPDLERRFAGLRRLYGEAGYAKIRAARVAIIGVGGVGSWAAEALARCGVAALTLIDLDHVSESNVNRQVQALGATLGQAKVLALQTRIADIHPGCAVDTIEEFADAQNWPQLLTQPVDLGFRTLPAQRVLVIGAGLVVALLAAWTVTRTRFGIWLRAAVDHSDTAATLGIPIRAVQCASFAIGAALAGLGGILGAELLPLEPYYALKYLVLVLVVVAVGGMLNTL